MRSSSASKDSAIFPRIRLQNKFVFQKIKKLQVFLLDELPQSRVSGCTYREGGREGGRERRERDHAGRI